METDLLIGRESELAKIKEVVGRGGLGHGRVVFVEGIFGMGKTALVKAVEAQTHAIPELSKSVFAYGGCNPITGPQNAYQPFVDILDYLSRLDKQRSGLKGLLVSILKETAPDWVQVVPALGPAVSAGVKTLTVASDWFHAVDDGKQSNRAAALETQYVNTIAKIASNQTLLVLVVEDAQWIDNASCGLLARLAKTATDSKLVVVVSYNPEGLTERHPLQVLRTQMQVMSAATIVRLSGLNEDQIRSYIKGRFGGPLAPYLASWLRDLSGGLPLFVSQYLSLLEDNGAIRLDAGAYVLDGDVKRVSGDWEVTGALKSASIPDNIQALLEQRIQLLQDEEARELLKLGAVQGVHFMALVLAGLSSESEDSIMTRMNRVREETRLIRALGIGEDLSKIGSQSYEFENILMQKAFYDRLAPYEQVRYHHKVAELLERLLAEQPSPSRSLILEVARQYKSSDEPLKAASYFYRAAQSSFSDGALQETVVLCRTAIAEVRSLPEGKPDNDRLRSQVIQLLLASSELWWRGKPELQGDLPLLALQEEAERAASRTGDAALLARAKYLRGRILLGSQGLGPAIDALKEAREIAHGAGDYLEEFIILIWLGHDTVGDNLATGLDLLYEAQRLYQERIAPTDAKLQPDVARQLGHLHGRIGVGEFDRGNFDEAVKWLRTSVDQMKTVAGAGELPWIMNFLAQAYTAMGLFEKAEAIINEAIDLHRDLQDPTSVRGYNRAFLGKLYMEWSRIPDAAQPLLDGWKETLAAYDVSTGPLVRNFYAELLMHPAYAKRDLPEADRQLESNIEETTKCGFYRSETSALSLRGQLAIARGDVDLALKYSTAAVELLGARGEMPALRSEEVFFNHYLVLNAARKPEEGRTYLGKANEVIQRKAASIADLSQRKNFLERVPLNKSITVAYCSPT